MDGLEKLESERLMFYSLIIPVYNRPGEIDELLQSLERLSCKNFEVIVVEDGSSLPCRQIIDKYARSSLTVKYFVKPNAGPGLARNYGAERSKGDYLIFLDSDCVVPEQYLAEVEKELTAHPADAFGGPDNAAPSFSAMQKAVNYSMTSFFTTGGIRGGTKRLDKFYPRSFNLGVSRKAFAAIGGFSAMRYGEDIDFSIRIFQSGYVCRLFPNAWVYHKRRTDLKSFFRQVYHSGVARINLHKKHPCSLKLVFMLPACFVAAIFGMVLLSVFVCPWFIFPLLLYFLLIFIDASVKNRSVRIGFLSVLTSFVQLFAYGCGFIFAFAKSLR